MIIFVDYDNIPESEKRKGLVFVIETAAERLSELKATFELRLDVRIYGGWFDGDLMSPRAQKVAAEISADFPRRIYPKNLSSGVLVSCELALSMVAEKSVVLTHTFRKRGNPVGLKCYEPYEVTCSTNPCALLGARILLSRNACPEASCATSRSNFIYRAEQKLVDTMLSLDIIHVADKLKKNIVLISSDDDFVPSLRLSLLAGIKVFHLHAQPGQATPTHYTRGLSQNYQTRNMW